MATLQPGDQAPTFTLADQNSTPVSLGDYAGQKLLVYFYPKADTSGCTAQSCSVRDHLEQLSALGVAAVGISPDKPKDQQKFDTKYTLGFPLLSDADHTVAEAYGTWGEKSMYGKTYLGIVRSSFLIDEEGRVIEAWYKVSPGDTVPKALEALGV
ncbi:MAG TPA: thioredoxin-dependent thiol peroxidase [Actinomycetota bacterium]|nr:thioredoxin-dependent thiol peroxidase [Actinomycetota bacterium]